MAPFMPLLFGARSSALVAVSSMDEAPGGLASLFAGAGYLYAPFSVYGHYMRFCCGSAGTYAVNLFSRSVLMARVHS